MLFYLIMAALAASQAAAQNLAAITRLTASAQISSKSSLLSTSSSFVSSSNYPIATIFMPIDIPENLAGSIIRAVSTDNSHGEVQQPLMEQQGRDKTTFVLSCIPRTESNCDFGSSVTLTEGQSTLIYTMRYDDQSPATVNCNLEGRPYATAATCTGRSAISGLGNVASTSTLASSQISYASVPITAGAAKLTAVPEPLGGAGDMGKHRGGGSRSASGGAARERPDARWILGGAVAGIAVLAAL